MKIQVLRYVMSCHAMSTGKYSCSLQLRGPAVREDCRINYSLRISRNIQRVNKNM